VDPQRAEHWGWRLLVDDRGLARVAVATAE
jgi:hypothetical protein